MKLRLTFLLIILSSCAFATHMIGGYIAMQYVSGLTYNVKFVSITNVGPQIQADRCWQTIYFSDGDSIIVPRVNGPAGNVTCDSMMGEIIATNLKYSVYQGIKTFTNQGSYKAWVYDENRNDGIINLPGSVNVPFYCETFLTVVDPLLYCPISTVDFAMFPVYNAKVNLPYSSDLPIAHSDGDSITYKIDTCKSLNGNNVAGYFIPQGVSINMNNGKFAIAPQQQQGQLAFAIRAHKWRNGALVSYTILDFGMYMSASFVNNINLPINANFTLNNDSIFVGNFTVSDTIKINYDNSAQYQMSLYSEINNYLTAQNTVGNITSISLNNLTNLERKQPYKITLRAWQNQVNNNAAKDYVFYFTIGNNDSTLCTLPQDLAAKNRIDNKVIFYPNPTQNTITILDKPNEFVYVYDMLGNIVLSQKLISNNETLNFDLIPQGVYTIKIGNHIQKLIKN